MRQVKKEITSKGKKLGDFIYNEPSSIAEAIEMFGELETLLKICRALLRENVERERSKLTSKRLPRNVQRALRTNKELLKIVTDAMAKESI